jgi:rubrerythrin
MDYGFTADEIFEMAQQIEKNGASFYRAAAEGVDNAIFKKMLLNLARMEDEHEKTFTDMRASLSAKEKSATFFDPENQAGQYLKALADTRVFFNKALDLSSMVEILKEALVAEKDSIVFYLGMKEMIPNERGKSRIDAVIKEEMNHIQVISQKLLAL